MDEAASLGSESTSVLVRLISKRSQEGADRGAEGATVDLASVDNEGTGGSSSTAHPATAKKAGHEEMKAMRLDYQAANERVFAIEEAKIAARERALALEAAREERMLALEAAKEERVAASEKRAFALEVAKALGDEKVIRDLLNKYT